MASPFSNVPSRKTKQASRPMKTGLVSQKGKAASSNHHQFSVQTPYWFWGRIPGTPLGTSRPPWCDQNPTKITDLHLLDLSLRFLWTITMWIQSKFILFLPYTPENKRMSPKKGPFLWEIHLPTIVFHRLVKLIMAYYDPYLEVQDTGCNWLYVGL